MGFLKYSHDPEAVLDYVFDWAAFLADINDTIDSATVDASTIADDDAPLTVDVVSNTTTTVTAWVSGGTVGKSYTLTCHIITNDGREEDKSITLQIKEH